MRFYFLLVGLCLLFASCEEQEYEVNGQVFIVTQGGQNIPLGLVSIGLMDYELIDVELKDRLEVFDNQVAALEKSIDELNIEAENQLKDSLWSNVILESKSKSVQSFIREGVEYALLDAKKRYNQFSNFISLEESSRDRQLELYGVESLSNRHQLNSLIEYDLQREKINTLLSERDLIAQRLDEFQKGYSVLPPLEAKFLRTKTNSQGNFKMKLKKGKYFIFASASRSIGAEIEKYMWAEILEVNDEINDFFFSNDNLVSIREIKSIR